MAQLAEVLLAQAEEGGAVELGVAADGVVRVRVQVAPARVPPDLLGLVATLQIHGGGVPVLLLAPDVVAALEQQDALPRGSEIVDQRPPAGPGPDHDHVVAVRHGASSLWVRPAQAPVTRV